MTLPSVFISIQQLCNINAVHKPHPTLTSEALCILKSITTYSVEVTRVSWLLLSHVICRHQILSFIRYWCFLRRRFHLHEPMDSEPLITNFYNKVCHVNPFNPVYITANCFLKSILNWFSSLCVSRPKQKILNIVSYLIFFVVGLLFLPSCYMSDLLLSPTIPV